MQSAAGLNRSSSANLPEKVPQSTNEQNGNVEAEVDPVP